MDRRSFLRGSVGLAMAGAFAHLDLTRAGAGTDPAPPAPAFVAPPPASWPPQPGAFDGLTADWVLGENALPGHAGWRIGGAEPAGVLQADGPVARPIEGYLNTTSAALGERIAFHVSTPSPSYTIEAYRTGWYGGAGARLVWQSDPLPGWQQRAPRIDNDTNMAEALWDTSYELSLHGPPFVPGVYLFVLTTAGGSKRYVPLTIRDDHSRARYLFVNAVADWQAYNEWGGGSVYYGGTGRSRNYGRRARVVSFDRPYDWGLGAGDFLGAELPLLMRIEEAGLDVTYVTSIDVHANPELLQRHTAVLSTAHDEYWSLQMRQAFEAARDKGVNIAFFGANAMFRQVRFQDSPTGKFRREVCYKSSEEDPVDDRSLTTVNWRDSPVSKPEASIIGVQYDGQGFADLEVTHPDGWLWEATGVGRGHKFRGVIGPEFDRAFSASPGNLQIFARSAIMEKQDRETFADTAYYSAPSGAGVFASGTIGWINQLKTHYDRTDPIEPVLYHATMNVLRLFGRGPAGKERPSIANAASARATPLPKPPPKKYAPGVGVPPPAPTPAPTPPTPTTTLPPDPIPII
jgi:hypothetical protein